MDLHGLTLPYIDAVRAAGGAAVLLPMGASEDELRALVGKLDGLLLPGGVDLVPAAYGQDALPECGATDERQDALELSLARLAVERGLPLLAICRGLQVLNVALGGTLWQDLPSQVPAAQAHGFFGQQNRNRLVHAVRLEFGSRLHAIMGVERVETNSSHHQAVRELAPGLVVTGRAPDGVVEAVELPEHRFAVGVQWHPEGMYQQYPSMLRPFAALIESARDYRTR